MENKTLSVDARCGRQFGDTLRKANHLSTGLVREYLIRIADSDDRSRSAVKRIRELSSRSKGRVG